jgi:acyl-CoA synthetase (AMP-forming)/AMP-acid ligase II
MADGKRWFRTGDQGAFDDEGYLRLTGRLKEIINRGGEKISPLEVDAVLLGHPEIAQIVCFGVSHPKLGEDIAAAVVLTEGSQLNEKDIRAFAAEHIANFKVPRSIMILEEIPKGPTGKIQRIGMAEKLGMTLD